MKSKLAFLLFLLAALGGTARAQINNARMLSTPNAQTGTTYTFVPADTTRIVTFNNASPVAVTLPNGATQGFGAGTVLSVQNLGAGTVTITCSSCTINGIGSLALGQGQGGDIYGGWGSPAVSYAAIVSSNGGGSGSIIGCTTGGGIGYESGTNNTLTCGANLTYQTSPSELFAQCDPNTNLDGCILNDLTGTVTGTTGTDEFALQNNAIITINSPNSTATAFLGDFSGVIAAGSGTFTNDLVGVAGGSVYTGTGTVHDFISVEATANSNTGGGTVTTNYGFFSADQSGVGTTNYDYFAPATLTGANYGYYSGGGRSFASAEGAAPTGAANIDILYGDSTNHQWEMINNGGSPVAITGVVTPMTPNVLPKGVGPTTLVNSSIVDNGSTVTTTEPIVAPAATAGSGASSAGAGASGGFACNETSGTGWTATAGQDYIRCDSGTHSLVESANGAVEHHLPQLIASGTAAMTTAGITAGNCGVTVTVSATGVATTDTIAWSFNAAPAGSNAGIVSWPTTNNVNFAYCSNTAQTPAAATINWKVTR